MIKLSDAAQTVIWSQHMRQIAEIDTRIAEIIAGAEKVSRDEDVIYPGTTGAELDELVERRTGILIGDETASTR